MESKAFYKHDSNSRNSAKILRVRSKFHAAGYGVYHMLLERLRDEESHISDADYDMLAMDIQESPEMIRAVVEDFGLFQLSEDGKKFWSDEFLRRLGPSDELRSKRSEAGRKGAQQRWGATNNINHNRMAKNGKNMAKDSICHTDDGGDMAKVWQNPAQNGKEWQIEGKEREVEKEINKEKEKKFFFSERNGDLSSDDSYERIVADFFFRNYPAPSEEYRRLVAYNGTERWAKMTPSERIDAAKLWRQKPERPARLDRRFLEVWERIYGNLQKRDDADESVRLAFLSDDISTSQSGKIFTLRCPRAVYDFIEESGSPERFSMVKTCFIPFMKETKCTRLNYDIID